MEQPTTAVRIRDTQYSRWENGCWITSYHPAEEVGRLKAQAAAAALGQVPDGVAGKATP